MLSKAAISARSTESSLAIGFQGYAKTSNLMGLCASNLSKKDFDAVCFSYGYTKRRMLWECKGIEVGQGLKEWGAPDYETFIIKLGKRL